MQALRDADGACPAFGPITSSTGRTGHLTDLEIDGITRSYAVECKNRESIGSWLFDLVEQTRERSKPLNKIGLVVLKKNRQSPVVLVSLEDFLALTKTRP